ncbi:glycoside hydrolase family 20 protein [Salegentibacter chungangensis]|uniref:beta-N-acetylhexosaminidase n=1 Tax=Salegentibacter chungangensis TaxID=1335724 RepID=A0ABW3NMP5_9FLAO
MKLAQALLCFGIVLFSACSGKAQKNFSKEEIVLIPEPKEMKLEKGNFRFTETTRFVVENERQKEIAGLLNSKFKSAAGWEMEVSEEVPESNFIQFTANTNIEKEAYRLRVDGEKVLLEAASASGFIYGLESIRQLLPKEIESEGKAGNTEWLIPQIQINDAPRYEWRGLMLDVSRHFFEKEYVLKVIDRLAFLKMNNLHLHLVDDQGWRIEIKEYPKLTEVGAFRVDQEDKAWNSRPVPEKGEKATYGGFYTQEEIKEIVGYAHKRGVNVVPEIEMPAHVMSAIAAYPELSCNESEIMVPSGGVWPITEIYCPGKESTFEFLENILLEVMELFPSKYIHVGGDEATRTNWESCPDCQRRIKEEDLAGTDELQSYFMKRIEKFLNENGRTLIGWDEILEGGLPEEAAVMSWRGIKGGWEASKEGHDVVMSPGSHVYFDHYQGSPDSEPKAFGGYTPLSKVYQFDPVVDSMSVAQKEHILGGQANLWSEYIPTNAHSEYMMFPRLVALSEVLWSPDEKLDWRDFSGRIQQMFPRLELMDINYATSAYNVTAEAETDLEKKKLRLKLKTEFPDSEIKYALGDEKLTPSSKTYTEPILLKKSAGLKAAVFEDGNIKGDTLLKDFRFHKAVAKKTKFKPGYDHRYTGQGKSTLVNVLRGTRNFHDGQWLGWLGEDVETEIDLGELSEIKSIKLGAMENQGSGIYYPVKITAFISKGGKEFSQIGEIKRAFKNNGNADLKDFEIKTEPVEARYIKLKVETYKGLPGNGKVWLFLDEIIVE